MDKLHEKPVTLLCQLLLSILVFTIVGSSGMGSEADGWVEATGEAVFVESKTLKEVKQEALTNARRSAIEEVVGIEVKSDTFISNHKFQSDFVESISAGTIVEEKILGWQTQIIKGEGADVPIMIYKVRIKVKVAVEKGKPDLSFKVSANLNRSVYHDGDRMEISILSTKNCYIQIFVVTENGKAYHLFPNRYHTDNYLEKNKTFVYPSKSDVSKGLALNVGLLPGTEKSQEYIKLIATKQPVSFTPGDFEEALSLDSYLEETSSMKKLIKELMTIPPHERTEISAAYKILK